MDDDYYILFLKDEKEECVMIIISKEEKPQKYMAKNKSDKKSHKELFLEATKAWGEKKK